MSTNSDESFRDSQDQHGFDDVDPNLLDQANIDVEGAETKEDESPTSDERKSDDNENEDVVSPDNSYHKVNIEFDDEPYEPYRSNRRSTNALQTIIDTSRRQSRDFKRTDKLVTAVTVKTKPTIPCNGNKAAGLKIGGEVLEVRSTPKSLKSISTIKNYDKTERHMLAEDDKQTFIKAAGGYVLTKHNKLNFIDITPNAEGALNQVHNLQAQLKALRQHCVKYDIVDTCTIVLPIDVSKSHQIRDETFDIFTDYPKLHPDIVANSCAFYNLWAAQPYVSENMGLVYNMLQSNTDEALWNKCLEEYEEYEPVQQGGPLMFFLILKHIQDVSENSIQHLRSQLKKMKISKVPGENIGVVVSLVKATYKTLKAASSKHHSYIPDDFPKTVLQIFQTSSVPEFNQAFEDEEKLAQRSADKLGGLPVWPTINEITSLATNTYTRLKGTNQWVRAKPAAALNATGKSNSKSKKTSDSKSNSNSSANANLNFDEKDLSNPKKSKRYDPECWNCGGSHSLKDCTKPHDEDKIKSNKNKFYEKLKAKRAARAKKRANKAEATAASADTAVATTEDTSSTSSPDASPRRVTFGADQIRSALRK